MSPKVLAVVFFVSISSLVSAQEKKVRRPDLPGSFLIEFGFNRALGTTPTHFDQGFWGSRTLNLYYQYPIRLLKSNFSYNPGFGFSFERYKLTNNYTLARQPDANGTYLLVLASDLNMPGADKSMLIMNYIDFMPAEFRYDTNPEDLARSLHIAVGARVGLLFESHTKVNYSEAGETKTIKDQQNHGLNQFRYGFYSRFGVGGFNLFTYYNVTPIFKDNKGPDQTIMNTLTFGISLSGF